MSAYKSRILLIRFAKTFPFILCAIIASAYTECLFSLVYSKYIMYDTTVLLYTPINWWFAQYYEYTMVAIIISTIMSFAMETCIYNKIAIVYALCNLLLKSVITFELDEHGIYTIVIINILVSTFITYKGLTIFINNLKLTNNGKLEKKR